MADDINARGLANWETTVEITCKERSPPGKDVTDEVRTWSKAFLALKDIRDEIGVSSSHILEVGLVKKCYLETMTVTLGSTVPFTLKARVGPCSAKKGCSGTFVPRSPVMVFFRNKKDGIKLE